MEAKKAAVQAKPGPAKPGAAKPKSVIEAYSFRKHGWPYLRQAAFAFGAALLLGGALVAASRYVLLQTRPDTAAAQMRQVAARDRLAQGKMERIDIRDFQPRFESLQARGFVGPENRLAMVESIQAIQKAHGILPITFTLLPQQAVAVDPALLEPPLALNASGMQLRMELLHEMDLINFFRDLKARGFFTVRECKIVSLGEVPAECETARLSAECTLYWLSVGDAAVLADPAAGA